MGRDCKLRYPTVIAIRDQEVIGCVSTETRKGGVVAYALIVNPDIKGGITWLRLADTYESVLFRSGIQEYKFDILKNTGSWVKACQRALNVKPYTEDGDRYYYKKNIERRSGWEV